MGKTGIWRNTSSALERGLDAEPRLFVPHPNLDERVNRNICQSEIEGGVFLGNMEPGAVLVVETRNRMYLLECRGENQVLISGHPEFCPEPVRVDVHGSTWGGTMLKVHFIGRGMHLEFSHPEFGIIHTSQIQEIRELPPTAATHRSSLFYMSTN
jgi:hypothetical protein